MQSRSTAKSDQFSVAPEPLQFGRRGSLATVRQRCCEHFVADDEWSTSDRGDNASLAAPSL